MEFLSFGYMDTFWCLLYVKTVDGLVSKISDKCIEVLKMFFNVGSVSFLS